MNKLTYPKKSHPGKAGRKATPEPVFLKRFRATEQEQIEFMSMLTGDAREDFVLILEALRGSHAGIR
jgi:hypothetical protein